MSSIDTIKYLIHYNHIIKELHYELLNMQNKIVTFQWIRSHAGFCGNKAADALARKRTTSKYIIKNYKKPVSVFYKLSTKTAFKNHWQDLWTNCEKGRYTFNILNKIDFNIIYFLSGHRSFPDFLH